MIQEYLFMDATHRTAVESYAPSKVTVSIYDVENSTCWTVTYSLSGETEENAKALSQVNEYVLEHFHPTVLSNESAAYFNQRLYPYINEFERKLRKLLYLKSAIYSGDKKIDNIRDLEAKDLGTIFELLFTDSEFVTTAKKKVNEKTWQYTKKEIIATLQAIAEDTVWDSLLGVESVKLLSENFLTVKSYRNDVMHAHNIDAKTFRDAKKLFSDINKQLDAEIGLIIRKAKEEPEKTADSEFNDALNSALMAQNLSDAVQQASKSLVDLTGGRPDAMRDVLKQIRESYSTPITYTQLAASMKPLLDLYSGTDLARMQHSIRESVASINSLGYDELLKQARETNALTKALKELKPTLDALKINATNNDESSHLESDKQTTADEEEAKNADT